MKLVIGCVLFVAGLLMLVSPEYSDGGGIFWLVVGLILIWSNTHSSAPKAKQETPQAKRSEKAVDGSMAGKFFLGNGWQGRIEKQVSGDVYLVQFFSWVTGFPTTQELIKVDVMLGWKFYDTEDEWHVAAEAQKPQ
jgi:hypothetical protein